MPITPQEALQRTDRAPRDLPRRDAADHAAHHERRAVARDDGALITGLRVKKETIGEITAAAQVMREFSTKVHVPTRRTWSTSSAPAATARTPSTSPPAPCSWPAAAGAKVSKHGGRSVSSKSGSADVLEAMGLNINLSPEAIARCIAETASASCSRPTTIPAMKNVAPVRKELGVRTIFNILGR
jgi:anthranilate phosphoribosyltransferase